jgi:hypothetical protein
MLDALIGWATYILAISALVGVFILCWWLFGPPMMDRQRSFAFVAGGGSLAVITAVGVAVAAVLYSVALTK